MPPLIFSRLHSILAPSIGSCTFGLVLSFLLLKASPANRRSTRQLGNLRKPQFLSEFTDSRDFYVYGIGAPTIPPELESVCPLSLELEVDCPDGRGKAH